MALALVFVAGLAWVAVRLSQLPLTPSMRQPAPIIPLLPADQRPLRLPVAFAAVILLVSGYMLATAPTLTPGLVLLAVGWGLLLAVTRPASGPVVRPIADINAPLSIPLLLAGGAALTLLGAANAGLLVGLSIHLQFGLLCAGVGLVIVGARGLPVQIDRAWRELALVGVVSAVGLLLRLWQIDDSVRFLVDEIHFTQAVEVLWMQSDVGLLLPFSEIAAFPYLFPYLQMLSVDLLGRSLFGLRAASAVLGTLMLPAFYLLLRALWDRRSALVGLVLLAAFPPHLHFSRLGIIEIGGALFGLLALAALAQALRSGMRAWLILGAAALGLTHYFHEGARLLFTPLLMLWLLIYLRPRRCLISAAGVTFIIAAPVYIALLGQGRSLASRMATQHISLDVAYWQSVLSGGLIDHIEQHILPTLLIYVRYIDDSLFYRGETALLLPVMTGFVLIGVVYAVRRPHAGVLVGLWLAAVSAGNSLLLNSIQSPRYVVGFPALIALAAIGITGTVERLLRSERWRRGALVTLVIVLAVGQVRYYFVEHLPVYNQQSRDLWGHRDGQDAILRSLDFPPGTQIHIISSTPPAPVYIQALLSFLTDDYPLDIRTPDDASDRYLADLPGDVDHAFFIEPDAGQVLGRLREHFFLFPPETGTLAPEHRFVLHYAPAIP